MKIGVPQDVEYLGHGIGDALGRRRLHRRLELQAVALDEVGLPARVQATLGGGLAVVVAGGVQGHVGVGHQVAEGARALEGPRQVAGAEGVDQAAIDLLDLPGQAALARRRQGYGCCRFARSRASSVRVLLAYMSNADPIFTK